MGCACVALTQGDGTIDYTEFTLGLARLTQGTVGEKLSLMFDVFDTTRYSSLGIRPHTQH